MKFRLFNISLILALLGAFPVAAADAPPFNFKGIYEVRFAAVPIGRVGIEAEQSAAHYSITADIATVGVAKVFTKHSSHTVVSGTGAGFLYPNVFYDTHYSTRNKKKAVQMVQKNGEIAETLEPPENPQKRPPVPAERKKGAIDPLTLNMALRARVWEAIENNQPAFSINIYDGRRLTQVDAAVAGKKIIRLENKKVSTLRVALRRKLLAGFTASELEDFDPEEPTVWIYYSDDGRLAPLYLETKFLFGKLSATLAKECRTGESCLLGIRE